MQGQSSSLLEDIALRQKYSLDTSWQSSYNVLYGSIVNALYAHIYQDYVWKVCFRSSDRWVVKGAALRLQSPLEVWVQIPLLTVFSPPGTIACNMILSNTMLQHFYCHFLTHSFEIVFSRCSLMNLWVCFSACVALSTIFTYSALTEELVCDIGPVADTK